MQDEMLKYAGSDGRLPLPDTLFVMNAYDKPLCPSGECPAPIFSYNKPWRQRTGGGEGGGSQREGAAKRSLLSNPSSLRENVNRIASRGKPSTSAHNGVGVRGDLPLRLLEYDDVLFPVLNHPFDLLVYFPWENKSHVAMMRAGIYPAMDARCSRVRLFELGQTAAAKGRVDIGIYKNRHTKVKVPLVSHGVPLQVAFMTMIT